MGTPITVGPPAGGASKNSLPGDSAGVSGGGVGGLQLSVPGVSAEDKVAATEKEKREKLTRQRLHGSEEFSYVPVLPGTVPPRMSAREAAAFVRNEAARESGVSIASTAGVCVCERERVSECV
jgi:hypothetical protein